MVVKKENEKNKENVGSSESQITIFTNRINRLTEHLKNNKKDENLKVSERLRVHHIFNELYEAVKKSRKDKQWNLKTYYKYNQ